MKFAGADFSGAQKEPNETWLAYGELGSLGLELVEVRKVGSHQLARELDQLDNLACAGLDFPFSLPAAFLVSLEEKLGRSFNSWQDVAEWLAFTSQDAFIALVVEFGKEPKRLCDSTGKRPAQSPLHRGNPSMVQMTWTGIRLLSTLNPSRYRILPFQDKSAGCASILEVYPRESLFRFGLPDTGYKAKTAKEKQKMEETRRGMLDRLLNLREVLGAKFGKCPRLSVSKNLVNSVVATDHAFDAVVACYTAACWEQAPELFGDPLEADDVNILLEGWIYAPDKL